MNTYAFASIKQLLELIKNKQLSREEILSFALRRFEEWDSTIASALEIFDRHTLQGVAQESGLLSGIPGLIKDNICQQGRITSCASKILSNYYATYNATAVEKLQKEGAVLIGRANMDEFAMGSSTETSAFKKTVNPWNFERVPGGSSGGSAAAVAAGFVPWSLGSETGGSVRQPASFCGIVGSKPTYGRVSRYGLIAYGSSLDQVGVFTRTVYDNALVLSTIAGHDERDSSSLAYEVPAYAHLLQDKLPAGLRIGIIDNTLNANGLDNGIVGAIETAIKHFESLGASIKRVALPALDYAAAAYFIISRAEAASNLARFDGVRYGLRNKNAATLADMYSTTRHEGFGPEVKSRIITGNYVLSAGHSGDFYINALKIRHKIRAEFIDTFKDVDLILMPVNPVPAFKFGAYANNKLEMDLQDYFTCPINLAGVPAVSLPCGFTGDNLPIGMQLVGPHLAELLIYQVAHVYEQHNPWYTLRPPTL